MTSKPPLPVGATKSRTESPSFLRATKSNADRPCPLSRDSLLYLRRRSNALICSFTSGYPENSSCNSSAAAAAPSFSDLHSSPNPGGGATSSFGTASSFDAAPSSSDGVVVVELLHDADAAFAFRKDDSESARFLSRPAPPHGKPPLLDQFSTSSASEVASPRHVCAAFAGVGTGFGAGFFCVVCGKEAPKKATAVNGGVAAEKSAASRKRIPRSAHHRIAAAASDGVELASAGATAGAAADGPNRSGEIEETKNARQFSTKQLGKFRSHWYRLLYEKRKKKNNKKKC